MLRCGAVLEYSDILCTVSAELYDVVRRQRDAFLKPLVVLDRKRLASSRKKGVQGSGEEVEKEEEEEEESREKQRAQAKIRLLGDRLVCF